MVTVWLVAVEFVAAAAPFEYPWFTRLKLHALAIGCCSRYGNIIANALQLPQAAGADETPVSRFPVVHPPGAKVPTVA
jgi:hypothetical protein